MTSSFASVLDEAHFFDPDHTFSEASWNPAGLDDIHSSAATAYRVSKTLAEKAAWEFVEKEKPGWDLVTITPPLVLGPVVKHLASLESINTSNERVVKLLQGGWKEEIPSQGPVALWIDVRDLARAHVAAFEKPDAKGKRLFTTAGYFSNSEIAAIARSKFPEFGDKIPGPDVKGGEPPAADKTFKYNTEQTDKLLGFEWTSLEKSIVDLVEGLKALGV